MSRERNGMADQGMREARHVGEGGREVSEEEREG